MLISVHYQVSSRQGSAQGVESADFKKIRGI